MYYAICTFSGIEVYPTNLGKYIFAAVSILSGALIVSYIFGAVAYSINSLNKQKMRLFDHIGRINSMLKNWNTPVRI